jgi:two-component system sensor histidine kinase HydH
MKTSPFTAKLPFKLSRAALGLILSTLFLAGLLTFSTLQNINRERAMMERFLRQNGETIIKAIEAAMRTSMMHHLEKVDALYTLLSESSRAHDIVFIIITDQGGEVISQTDNAPPASSLAQNRHRLGDSGNSVTSLEEETGIFTITRRLSLNSHLRRQPMMRGRTSAADQDHPLNDSIISIGLYTHEFDAARRQDVQHAIFMGAILFLVGSAGLYVLFLYQGMRVAKFTLENMKIYTENVIESIPVGLVTLDNRDRVVSCNRKMEELTGRTIDELHGQELREAFPGCRLHAKEICNSVFDYSTECVKEDGTSMPVKIGGSALVSGSGDSLGTVLVVRDMSVIRDMEQQLERSRRMAALGTMAAGIAHEIRNPLGTLKGFAHYFGNQPGTTEESRNYAKLMETEIDRLNRNISGLLQFARPRDPNIVSVVLDEVIGKTAALMERDFSEKGLNFHYQCNTALTVNTDPDMLIQVLLNLLKNSISATPEGGEVSLATSGDDKNLRITVADSGHGMTEQEREKMFDPFFTTRKTGTGLGLAVSHQIMEQLGGTFEVVTAPQAGTAVTVVLPHKKEV